MEEPRDVILHPGRPKPDEKRAPITRRCVAFPDWLWDAVIKTAFKRRVSPAQFIRTVMAEAVVNRKHQIADGIVQITEREKIG